MTPFDAYKQYLALKNHFGKSTYDYHKYAGKSRASVESFNKRKDKYWFEKLSRQKSDDEIKNFYISNFVESDDPNSLWIGNVIREGEVHYKDWIKRQQSLKYIFTQESENFFSEYNLDDAFDRRIFYKKAFELPDENARFQILQDLFPEWPSDWIKDIASDFELSGSQIQNIKRKLLVDSILFDIDYSNKELLVNYIEEELGFRKKNRTEIGFFKN